MSPQSIDFILLLKGFAFKGTLYPPLNPSLREFVSTARELYLRTRDSIGENLV